MIIGFLFGFKKEAAVKFLFLMLVFIIFGVGVVLFLKNINYVAVEFLNFVIGFFIFVIVGFFVIYFLFGIVKKSGFKIFVYYRFFLAVVILVFYFLRVV